MTEKLEYKKKDILKVLRYLSEIVVSLDRIGSSYHDLPEKLWEKALVDYVCDSKLSKKLAESRMILSSQFSDELGDDDMDELEREMQDLKHWSYKEFLNKNEV
jgi:hypothetical protein